MELHPISGLPGTMAMAAKVLAVFGGLLLVVAYTTLAERRIAAWIHSSALSLVNYQRRRVFAQSQARRKIEGYALAGMRLAAQHFHHGVGPGVCAYGVVADMDPYFADGFGKEMSIEVDNAKNLSQGDIQHPPDFSGHRFREITMDRLGRVKRRKQSRPALRDEFLQCGADGNQVCFRHGHPASQQVETCIRRSSRFAGKNSL